MTEDPFLTGAKIHPEAKRLLDASERIYEEEVALIRERLRPELGALLGLPEEELQLRRYELQLKEEEYLAGPTTEWYLRNWQICEWCRKNGIG